MMNTGKQAWQTLVCESHEWHQSFEKHGVEWNAMAVVNDFNADYPLDFYHFFKELGCHYIQFAPIVERIFPHQDGRHLASLAQREGRRTGRIFRNTGAMGAFSVHSSMNG